MTNSPSETCSLKSIAISTSGQDDFISIIYGGSGYPIDHSVMQISKKDVLNSLLLKTTDSIPHIDLFRERKKPQGRDRNIPTKNIEAVEL